MPNETQERPIIYLSPLLSGRNDLNAQLVRIIKRIEAEGIRNRVLCCVWREHGDAAPGNTMRMIRSRDARALISTGFGTVRNPKLNYFDINWKEGHAESQNVATDCAEVASVQSHSRVRMHPAIQYKNGVEQPNPVFAALPGAGLFIRPCYDSYERIDQILDDPEFFECYYAVLRTALTALDEAA